MLVLIAPRLLVVRDIKYTFLMASWWVVWYTVYLAFEKTITKVLWLDTIESKPKGCAASPLYWDEHCVHDDFATHNWPSLLTLSPFFLWFFHHPACQEEDWPAEREEPHGAVGHTASHEARFAQSRGVGGWERNCNSKDTVQLLEV